jgi:hypothetical protein
MFRPKQEDGCEECKAGYVTFAEYLSGDFGISEAVNYWSGEIFCMQSSFVDDNVDQICIEYVEAFFPKALPVLAQEMVDYSDLFCNIIYDTCEPKNKVVPIL